MSTSLRRKIKLTEEITHRAGEFIAREASPQSMITVTRAESAPDAKRVTIFFSVMPKERQEEAQRFLKRQRTHFHEYLKEKTVLNNVPTIDFVLDIGEENRQRIEELTQKKK